MASYYVHSCLTGFCNEYLAGELAYDSFDRGDGKWVVDNLTIDTEHRKFQAEQVHIELGFSPFSREIDLHVNIVNPRIDIQKKASELQAFLLECMPINLSNWAFKVNSRLTVEEGVVAWHPDEEASEQRAVFRLNGSCTKGVLDGRLVMKIDEGDIDRNIFEMKVAQSDGDPILAELTFHEVDCAQFCEAAAGFGASLNGWEVSEGTINGKISFSFDGEKRPQVVGKALLRNLAFHHPELKVEGKVEEASFDVRTDKMRDGHQGVVGKFEVSEDASIVLLNEGIPYWEIKRILGGIYFQGKDLAIVNVEGTCTHQDVTFGLNIEGDIRFPDAYQSSLDIAVELISPDENIASARLVARQLGALYNSAEIELKNIGKEEFAFVQAALARYSPEWKKIQMLGGGIDASGIVYMQKYRINEINIDNISAQRLKFEVIPWETVLSVTKAHGDLSMSLLKEDLLETINSNIIIIGGNFWEFTDINTEISVKNGVMQKSIMKGAFAGMEGTVELDWMSPQEVMKFNFNGGTQGLVAYLPEILKKGIEEKFIDDHLSLIARVNKQPSGLKVEGIMSFVSPSNENIDTISFGVDLERGSKQQLPESPAERLKAIKHLLPNISSAKELLVGQVINSDSNIAGFYTRNGWFKVSHVSLEKYLSPFLFPNGDIKISGFADFSGFLDVNQMAVEYEGRNIVIDSPHFRIELPKISKIAGHDPVHFFDFAQGTHFGFVPIFEGTYLQKRYGLTFNDVSGNLFWDGDKIRLADTKALAHGVSVSGQVDLDLSVPDVVAMEMSEFVATLSSYQANGNIKFEDFKKDSGNFNLSILNEEKETARLAGRVSSIGTNSTLIDLNNDLTIIAEVHPEDFHFIFNSEQQDIKIEMNLKLDEMSLTSEFIPQSNKIKFQSLQYKNGGLYSYLLQDFVLNIDPDSHKMHSMYHYENHPFHVELTYLSPDLTFGDLTLSGIDDHQEVMKISWTKDPEFGFQIKRVLGGFSGLQIDLNANGTVLQGNVQVKGARAVNLFPFEIRDKFQKLGVGDGFLLKGDWLVTNTIQFNGLLLGKDFKFYGYQFETLTSKLDCSWTEISLRDIKVSDPAVTIDVNKFDMTFADDNWHFCLPEMIITKLRPSKLCMAGGGRPMFEKPLIAKEIVLNDFHGIVSDPTSYRGEGYLSFTNKSKNPFQNTIFDVPAEIMARLGLDLSVMTPVIGSVHYEIKNGKIVLNKFKEMFSERKLSKFYLSEKHISTIDFDGNLDLQIRMKQYNLLFKLTEPFSFNIQGPYTKPSYRFNAEGRKPGVL